MTPAKSQGSESCEQGAHSFIKGLYYKDQTRGKSRTYQNQKCFTNLLLFLRNQIVLSDRNLSLFVKKRYSVYN